MNHAGPVSASDARAKFASMIATAQAGAVVPITSHGRVQAYLTPPSFVEGEQPEGVLVPYGVFGTYVLRALLHEAKWLVEVGNVLGAGDPAGSIFWHLWKEERASLVGYFADYFVEVLRGFEEAADTGSQVGVPAVEDVVHAVTMGLPHAAHAVEGDIRDHLLAGMRSRLVGAEAALLLGVAPYACDLGDIQRVPDIDDPNPEPYTRPPRFIPDEMLNMTGIDAWREHKASVLRWAACRQEPWTLATAAKVLPADLLPHLALILAELVDQGRLACENGWYSARPA
ncbi:hypothetical protein [Tsukamurella pulmonis]|uniref:hypothetical protein n=1 Tax=Tsukamurella pulmonis TaxID=47312 RepID=UPI001EDF71F3|nr:hypothetical protein [Tsukamurella pulmonis]